MRRLREVSVRGLRSTGLGLALTGLMLMGGTVSAKAKLDPELVGEWRANDGFTELVLRISADGRCVLDEEVGACSAQGGAFTFQGPETGRERYRYQLSGSTLTLSGGDLEGAMRFQRVGGGKAPPPRKPEPAGEDTEEEAVAPSPDLGSRSTSGKEVAPSGPGQSFQKEAWGVRFTVPAGWKYAEKSGVVLLGSDNEPGLMLARFVPSYGQQQAEQEFAQGYSDESVQLQPSGALKAWRGPSAQGLTGMMAGMTMRGEQVRARVIALFNRGGGGLVLMALTTPEHFSGLERRLEQMARTVSLTTPKVPKGRAAIAGSYWFYSSSSGGSSGATVHLCADGSFRREGEMSGRNYGGAANLASQDSGTWSAQGTALSGTLTLQYASGEVQQLAYEASQDPRDRSGYGPALIIGGRKYQKTGDGSCSG